MNDTTTQQQTVVVAGEITDTLRAFKNILGDQQKGLANFDPNDPLEVILKNLINATKDALEAVDILVYRIPILGPILGPSKSSFDLISRQNNSVNRLASCVRGEMHP